MTKDTSGFYRAKTGDDSTVELTHAPTAVYHKDYTLLKDLKDTYAYPVHGWTWYDDVNSARAANGLPPLDETE